MSTPNRSLPGWGEPQRSSHSYASRIAPQLAPPSGSSQQQSDCASTDAPPHKTEQEIIRSLLFTDDEQFEALSPETQQKILDMFASLSLFQQMRDSLKGQRRAKQAEAHAKQAEANAKQAEANASQVEADWLAGAIHVCEEAERQAEEEGIEFLHSVSLIDDDVYLSMWRDSY
ncbi:hypothetical protein CKAH01_17134 [Colletotrichum kahawae]|uniref:Uncharacterized protein n=1 Tax=Colletotrichum kahawae TaxID=34407 RepID=A0AAE0D5N4_COLKA|nr:hypothetical protein CKAH01_17134 [Colletotrichum kahawae]